MNTHLSKEDIQLTNKNMKRCLMLLIIKQTQIKIMRYYLVKTRMVINEKRANNKC